MFFVQYIPMCACGGRGPLQTERYSSLIVAQAALASLTAICWAELVGPDGSVLERREGPVEQPVHQRSAFREPE